MVRKIKLTLYFFAKWFGIFALTRNLSSGKVRILCYHGGSVGDEWQYNGKLFMTRQTFKRRVEWLREKGFHIVSLADAVALAESKGQRPRLPVALTFDDGWYSTGKELLPVLFAQGLPSTLYLCTSHFQENWPVFAVTVRYILWKSKLSQIEIKGVDDDLDGTYDLLELSSRESLIDKALRWLNLHVNDRNQAIVALSRIAFCAGLTYNDLNWDTRRFDYLSADELRALEKNLCSVEMHGHLHFYPTGRPEQLRQDLTTCRNIIVELGLEAPKHYCYPSGSFDSAAAAVLNELGVRSATTCIPGLISFVQEYDTYYLPRFVDGESVHMLEFEAEMSGFSHLVRWIARRV